MQLSNLCLEREIAYSTSALRNWIDVLRIFIIVHGLSNRFFLKAGFAPWHQLIAKYGVPILQDVRFDSAATNPAGSVARTCSKYTASILAQIIPYCQEAATFTSVYYQSISVRYIFDHDAPQSVPARNKLRNLAFWLCRKHVGLCS